MKRKGVGRLIPWLVALDVLLLAAFLIIRMSAPTAPAAAGTASAKNNVPLPPAPEVVETPAPFSFGDEPEQLLIDNSDAGRPAATAIPVKDSSKDVTLVSGSFAMRGGPNFSLYLDKETFQLIEMEGRCYFAPVSESGTLYLEIAYHPGSEAKNLSGSILWDYGVIIQSDDPEQVELSGQSALHLKAKTMETQIESWLVDVEGGCVSLTLCAPGGDTTEDHQALVAYAQTFAIEK